MSQNEESRDPSVPEEAGQESAPKKTTRRRSTPRKKPAAKSEPSDDGTAAETPEKPKPARKRRSTKKKADDEDAGSTAEGGADEAGEADGTEKPKPARKRRSPKKKAEEAAAVPDAGDGAEDEDPPKPKRRRTRKPPVKKEDAEPADAGAAEDSADPAATDDEKPAPKPRRRRSSAGTEAGKSSPKSKDGDGGDAEGSVDKDGAPSDEPKSRRRSSKGRRSASADAEERDSGESADGSGVGEPVTAASKGLEGDPRILERAKHPISRRNISEGTLKVLYRLDRQGYRAFLVGGGVRDLMLDREPKDFDVATDARPPEMKRLFRNARIIGRRFRLAHVIFRDEIVEVSTFRRTPDPDEQDTEEDDLLITSDNTWGSPAEDAFRRDFTINALFYDISDYTVIDYVGGLEDLEGRRVRVIGEPDVRFREDPVRMMRACEFAGRLGFEIEKETRASIERLSEEILRGAPPRLVEEVLGVLRSGHSARTLRWLRELGLLDVLVPELAELVEAGPSGDFRKIPEVLDELLAEGAKLEDPVLVGAVLLPRLLRDRFEIELESREWTGMQDFRELVFDVMDPMTERLPLPNAKVARMRQALLGFHRMCAPTWTRPQRLRIARKSYFPDACRLFEILVRATGDGRDELAAWQEAGKAAKSNRGGGRSGGSRRRRRRRR